MSSLETELPKSSTVTLVLRNSPLHIFATVDAPCSIKNPLYDILFRCFDGWENEAPALKQDVDLGLSDREMNRMAKTAEVLWSPIVQMSGASNTTLPGGPGNPIVGVTIGGSIGGVFVIVVLVGCMIYCKRKRDRNRNDYTLGQRSPSYSALELPQHNQNDVSIVDPLEKKPYTQLMLPLGAKPKERSKYGVCRYKVKGAATLSGSTRPPKASQSPVRNTQQLKTNADDDYTVIENTQQGIELYNLPSYDLVVAETT